MTSKIVVNNIEADTGISTVSTWKCILIVKLHLRCSSNLGLLTECCFKCSSTGDTPIGSTYDWSSTVIVTATSIYANSTGWITI